MEAADRSRAQQTPDRSTTKVLDLQGKHTKAQQVMTAIGR
jgi:hypothetical protein